MTKRVLVLLLFTCVAASTFGQTKPKRVGRPDIPGTFIVEYGFNRARKIPPNFSQGFWGSRTLNLYYQYPIRILKSKFSFVPAIGFSFERFKLTNNYTLSPIKEVDGSYSLIDANTLYPGTYKSMIVADYFEAPIGLRFDTSPEDMARSFNITIGARGGLLLDAFTKMKFNQDGERKIIKDKQNHGLNPYRYALFARIGVAGFHFFTYFNVSPLFAKNQGPQLTQMNTMTVGISINGF